MSAVWAVQPIFGGAPPRAGSRRPVIGWKYACPDPRCPAAAERPTAEEVHQLLDAHREDGTCAAAKAWRAARAAVLAIPLYAGRRLVGAAS